MIRTVLLIQGFDCLFSALFTFYERYKMYSITFMAPLLSSVLHIKATSLLELYVKQTLQTSFLKFQTDFFRTEYFSCVLSQMRLIHRLVLLFLMTLKSINLCICI